MIIYHHLGLGDHIICNGLVRHFAENNKVYLLCKSHNISNIQFMYRDDSNISIIPVNNDYEASAICDNYRSCIRCGFAIGGQQYNNVLWDENFYLNANIPFEYSWTKFKCHRDIDKEEELYQKLCNNKPYIFIHNQDSLGVDRINWNIIRKDISTIITNKTIPIFDYITIIERAYEVHCINSSFRHLVDRIQTNGKLYYHIKKEPRSYDECNSRKEWIIT